MRKHKTKNYCYYKASTSSKIVNLSLIHIFTGSNNYKWSPTTVFNSNKSDTVIVRPLTTTKYTVEASSVSGCRATADVVITVYKKPVISIVSPSCISAEPMRLSTSPKVRNVLWTLNNNNLLFKNTSFSSSGETIIGKSISADTAQLGQPNYCLLYTSRCV